MFRKWIYAFVAAAALAGASATPSRAAMLLTGLDPATAAPSRTEQAQLVVATGGFFFGGRQYCWYDAGWRGPGWYWCGYALRAGYGWGGGAGWQGHYYRGGGGRFAGHGNRGPGFVARPGRPHGGGRPNFGGRPHGGGGHGRPHGGGGHHGGGHRGGGRRHG